MTAVHEGAELPHYWRSKLADTDWPDLSMQGGNVSTAALVLLRAGKRERSIALDASARHLLTDVWTSAGVVLGHERSAEQLAMSHQ